jgi:hypothetical protein
MAAESALPASAIEAKYGKVRANALRLYGLRWALRAVGAVVVGVEDAVVDRALDVPIDRPVFVLGNFRSGTTFLEQVLARHPALGYFTLASSVLPRSPRFCDVLRRAVPGFADAMTFPHHPNMVVDATAPFEAESIWRACRNNPWSEHPSNVLDAGYSDPPFERILRRTIQKNLKHLGRARFINKNPPNTVRLGYLARVFPDARFVYIVRHPQRMLRSQLDMERTYRRLFPPEDGRDYGEFHSNLWVHRAKVFARTGRNAEIAAAYTRDPALGIAMSLVDVDRELQGMRERGRLGDRVMTIRYEDLVERFAEEIGKVLAFAGLDDDGGRALAHDASRSVDETLLSRRSPLPPFSPEVLAALRPYADRFGYALA